MLKKSQIFVIVGLVALVALYFGFQKYGDKFKISRSESEAAGCGNLVVTEARAFPNNPTLGMPVTIVGRIGNVGSCTVVGPFDYRVCLNGISGNCALATPTGTQEIQKSTYSESLRSYGAFPYANDVRVIRATQLGPNVVTVCADVTNRVAESSDTFQSNCRVTTFTVLPQKNTLSHSEAVKYLDDNDVKFSAAATFDQIPSVTIGSLIRLRALVKTKYVDFNVVQGTKFVYDSSHASGQPIVDLVPLTPDLSAADYFKLYKTELRPGQYFTKVLIEYLQKLRADVKCQDFQSGSAFFGGEVGARTVRCNDGNVPENFGSSQYIHARFPSQIQ